MLAPNGVGNQMAKNMEKEKGIWAFSGLYVGNMECGSLDICQHDFEACLRYPIPESLKAARATI